MSTSINRRSFLRTQLSAVLGAGVFPMIASSRALGRAGAPSPNGRVGVAAIGVGPQGQGVMSGVLAQSDARVVAVCSPYR